MVNVELTSAAATNRSLGSPPVRTLFGVPGGTIHLSDGWGKSAGATLTWVGTTSGYNQYSTGASDAFVTYLTTGAISSQGTIVNTSPTAYLTPLIPAASDYQVRWLFIDNGGPQVTAGGIVYPGGANAGVTTPWFNLGSAKTITTAGTTTSGYQTYTVQIQQISTGTLISRNGYLQWTP